MLISQKTLKLEKKISTGLEFSESYKLFDAYLI